MSSAGIRQYLERYATAETNLGAQLHGRYRAVLVVPAHREPPGFIGRYQAALNQAAGRVLLIVVVNAAAENARVTWPEHEALIASLVGDARGSVALAPSAWLLRAGNCDVLCIDRAHPEHCFPEREGVGLARRIGCDVALQAFARGLIEDPYIYCTDADAELPPDYFARREHPCEAACIAFGFWHVPVGDPAIDGATALYELGLRYYTAGLDYARSPFAYHSIGSTIAVRASIYAAVRGFPRRLAGEDFYLLNKAAKVGRIWRDDSRTIRLLSRASERTPHGTGAAAIALARAGAESLTFYHPHVFVALRHWLGLLEFFVQTRDLRAARALAEGAGHAPMVVVLENMGAWAALADAEAHTRATEPLRRRLHTWFDAFRTLKFVHALRERALPSLHFRQALELAPFRPDAVTADATVDGLRRAFSEQQARSPALLGLSAS